MFMDMNGWPEQRAVRTYGFLMMGFSLVSTVMFVVTARLANRSAVSDDAKVSSVEVELCVMRESIFYLTTKYIHHDGWVA